MDIETGKSELIQIEQWLKILMNTYALHPTSGLAKVIDYYFMRLANIEDITLDRDHTCSYFSLSKFWKYQANK
jgi:hypothetical protein